MEINFETIKNDSQSAIEEDPCFIFYVRKTHCVPLILNCCYIDAEKFTYPFDNCIQILLSLFSMLI